MARKRAISILKLDKINSKVSKPKKDNILTARAASTSTSTAKLHPAKAARPWQPKTGRQHQEAAPGPRPWVPASIVHRQAAYAIQRLLAADATGKGGATLKSLTLAPHIEAKRATHAVTCECLRHLFLLEQLVDRAGLLTACPRLGGPLAYVLVYDMMFGQAPRPNGAPERAVLAARPRLQEELAAVLAAAGVADVAALLAAQLPGGAAAAPHPRCVRVNTLRCGVDAAVAELRGAGHEHVDPDPLLPSVLLLPPGTDLHALPGVVAGRLVLQSRASCMPAAALRPPPGAALLDACAAPGNKTTQLAAMLGAGGGGSVLALDRDPTRATRLEAGVARAGAGSIVAVRCADFLQLEPEQHPEISGILLDPSCSGSGTEAARVDAMLPGAARRDGRPQDDPRVKALAAFQETALRHALRFPGLQRLTYSTCSVHQLENEDVVAAVLPDAEAAGMELVPALPGWPRRGWEGTCPGADCLLRTDANEDGTDGFFVALFQRRDLDPAWK